MLHKDVNQPGLWDSYRIRKLGACAITFEIG